jgi:hypothetical protein
MNWIVALAGALVGGALVLGTQYLLKKVFK